MTVSFFLSFLKIPPVNVILASNPRRVTDESDVNTSVISEPVDRSGEGIVDPQSVAKAPSKDPPISESESTTPLYILKQK